MNSNSGVHTLIMALGVLLVGAGGLLLAYLAMLVFQVIHSPDEVKIVQFILCDNARFFVSRRWSESSS
jgi:hypothetical protein